MSSENSMEKRGMTTKEVAMYTGLSVSFFAQNRMSCIRDNHTPGPIFIKVGSAVRYDRLDVDQWLEDNKVESKGGV